ncbi:MAG: HD domain-containing protein [Candidatus Sabulitectum sp.]|nr:HD domain-containing protein [Candidatus Sabulitectum sp.]
MFDIFKEAGYSLYLVGGAVRDRFLGVSPGDMDYATDASPVDVIDFLTETGIKVIPTGIRYGTVTAISPETHEKAEITTFRCSEVYRRGSRFPSVEFGGSIQEDLKRRDFTINAMAIDSSGELIDPCGGMKDLKKKVIDTPGEPDEAFLDDPLRILRAYRFAAKLGFSIAERVRQSARTFSEELASISPERKYKEITGLLAVKDGRRAAEALSLMKQDGVLLKVIPELEHLFVIDGLKQGKYHTGDAWQHTLDVVAQVPPVAILRWAALLHDSGKGLVRQIDEHGEPHFNGHEVQGEEIVNSVTERLRFSRADKKALAVLVRNHMRPVLYRSEWGNSAVRRLMRDAGDQMENLFILAEADIKAHKPDYVGRSLKALEELRERAAGQICGRILPAEMGQNLQAMGFEGPVIGTILRMLEDMAADGILPENPTVDQCFSALWDRQTRMLNESEKLSD